MGAIAACVLVAGTALTACSPTDEAGDTGDDDARSATESTIEASDESEVETDSDAAGETDVETKPDDSAETPTEPSEATAGNAEALAAAVTIARHANALVPTATHRDMTSEDLAAEEAASASLDETLSGAQAALTAAVGDRAGRITTLVDRMVGNAKRIGQGRPELLNAITESATNIRRLGVASTARLFPAAISAVDDQFFDLATALGSNAPPSDEDLLRYRLTADLAADLGFGHTLLTVVSQLTNPVYVARSQEAFDSAAERIRRSVDYLAAHGSADLAPELIPLARQQLAAGTGQNNLFDLLRLRLELVVAESDLIEENAVLLDQLLFEVEALTADIQGMPAPAPPMAEASSPAEPGITDDAILFGQSAAFSGPSQALGDGMRLGIEAAFHEANQDGGVHGRRLELMTLNDAYEADFAFANTLRLIEDEQVFALIGAVGTPTSRAASPIAHAAGVPFIAPFTGAELLRDPELTNVLNLRSSYLQETEEMVKRLTEDLDATRVAVLYQNDSYGVNGLEGVRQALERRGLAPVASWYYRRNTTAVKSAVISIAAADPEAVIIIGAYAPAAEAVRLLRNQIDPIFMAVSFVGSNALAAELGDAGTGFYVTQVVNLPDDTTVPVVASYAAALRDFDPNAEPGFVSLEGYLAGRLAIEGLKACGPDLSRECFLDAVYGSGTIDIDGLELTFAPGDNQGSDNVFLTVIGEDGSYRQVDRLERTP
ncbi:ABC transporter substrate-binding protein [Candidatus Poriferisodalis sp.]|uniref:ABC transporter substrate-binding protein n=1 Tax=Candidatus Poriferisodalis sp. TaxID=3101277 RepID=UPI003B012381